MISKNRFFIMMAALALLLLAGCGRTAEDEAAAAVKNARAAFESNPKQPTEKTEDIGFYKPAGWKADIRRDEHTVVLTKGKRTLTVHYDPNAAPDSRAYYDLLKSSGPQTVLEEETFSDSGAFGFIIIRKQSEALVEIIAGAGAAEVKTVAALHDAEKSAAEMMGIARSIQPQP